MTLKCENENVPVEVRSLCPTIIDHEDTSVVVLCESQMTSPPPVINIDSINSGIQTGDSVRFGEEIYILDRQSENGPIVYEATKEFKDYLRSQSNEDDGSNQNGVYQIISNNTTYGFWTHESVHIKRLFYSVVFLATVCTIVVLCNILFLQGKETNFLASFIAACAKENKFTSSLILSVDNVEVIEVPVSSWYVERGSWNPRTRRCPIADLKPLTRLVVLSQTSGVACRDLDSCLQKVRNAQGDSFRRPFCDINYNFLIGGDKRVYEGRVLKQRDNTSDAYFDKSIVIAFIGDCNVDIPSQEQFEHLQEFLKLLVEGKKLSADYKITAADRIQNIPSSPGYKVRDVVSKWERWTENPEDIFQQQIM